MSDELTMRIAQVVPSTEAEGPGRRFAVWFQGCPLRCPGCCNPEFLPFKGGEERMLGDMTTWMARTRRDEGIEGITLLGGEPFAHALPAAALAREARTLGLSVMVFSGYTIEQLRETPDTAVGDLLGRTDILVDGPYDRDRPDAQRRWVGSTNQRIHFLTDRYQFDDQWRRRNTLEIRVDRTGISVNGFPSKDAVGLWKGWKSKPRPADPAGAEPK